MKKKTKAPAQSDLGAQKLAHKEVITDQRGTKRLVVERPDGRVAYVEAQNKAGSQRLYTLDILRKWLDNSKISYSLFDAGRRFENVYRMANMGPNYATGSMERVDRSVSHDGFDYTSRPRATIKRWAGRLGPCYEPLEMILGHQLTFTELAKRHGHLGMRRVSDTSVAGQFLKALILLDIVIRDR